MPFPRLRRFAVPALLALAIPAIAPVAAGAAAASGHPDQLVVLSLTDTQSKYAPCGCSTPKGGWARQAFYVDSVRREYARVAFVDAGGFLPDVAAQLDLGAFFMQGMGKLGFDAVGVGDRDLKYGLDYLKTHVEKNRIPVVASNLVYRATKKPVFPTHVVKDIGGVKVGFFSLLGLEVDLGPSREQIGAREPMEVAAEMVKTLRAEGATVVVLLSQLGKVGSEDVPLNVKGIDVVIGGRSVPLLQRARSVEGAIVVHGGFQGQYMGQTTLTLDAQKRVATGDAMLAKLDPEVRDRADMAAMVQAWDEAHPPPAAKAQPASATPVASPD